MIERHTRLSERAQDLKHVFDLSFAAPVAVEVAANEDLLEIRVGATPYCLRLSEIAGLYNDKTITPLPGSLPSLLGIAGFRGAIIPVYSLAVLIGSTCTETPRWLAVMGGERVALAFDVFEGHLCVLPSALVPNDAHDLTHAHIRAIVHARGVPKPVLNLPSVLGAIKDRHLKRNHPHVQ